MKTLAEHNQERWAAHEWEANPVRPTGIQCPKCDGELHTVDNMCLTSDPPQRNVQCNKCQHRTTILA